MNRHTQFSGIDKNEYGTLSRCSMAYSFLQGKLQRWTHQKQLELSMRGSDGSRRIGKPKRKARRKSDLTWTFHAWDILTSWPSLLQECECNQNLNDKYDISILTYIYRKESFIEKNTAPAEKEGFPLFQNQVWRVWNKEDFSRQGKVADGGKERVESGGGCSLTLETALRVTLPL